MINKNVLYIFCFILILNFKFSLNCSCEPFNIETVICKSHFTLLVLVKGLGPSTKTHDLYYVEIRQSYNLNYHSAKTFSRDYGSGLVYIQKKFTSCALRLKSNELYLIFGHLKRDQPIISFCTTIKYDTLTDEEKMQLNLVSIKGLNCKK